MPFKDKVRKALGRSGSNPASPIDSAIQSQSVSGVNTPSLGSGSISPVARENMTIDPRENPLTRVETDATTKKKGTLSRIRSAMKKEDPYKDWPEDIYKPHEIPRPKYRRPVDPQHNETLQAYSLRGAFADTWRRRSYNSQYSPMASRLPSRVGSFSDLVRRSAAPSRNHSISNIATLAVNESAEDIQTTSQRRDTVTTTSSNVPDLVLSSSVDSEDMYSLQDTHAATETSDSRSDPIQSHASMSKPIDEEELTRAITQKLLVQEA